MKKGKQIIFVLVLGFMVIFTMQSVRAAEPYEQITNANEWELLKIVNEERVKQGQQPLAIFASLQKAAGVRSQEIAERFDHVRPDGTKCFTAIKEQGIRYGYAGENIAAGYTSPSDVMSGWMSSAGHRGNILSGSYSHIGIGYCNKGSYGNNWVQIFIGGCSVESIAVGGDGIAYPVGSSIEKMNRYLVVKCSDHGVGYVPVTEGMCTGYSKNQKGSQTITVSYRGKKAKFSVNIVDKAAEDKVTEGTTSDDKISGSGSSDNKNTEDGTSVKKPAKIKKLRAVKKTKTTISLKWKKRKATGYEVWMAKSKKGTYKKVKTITSPDRITIKVKKLKSGKKYYFKVRAYKKVDNKKIYGSFSKAVVVKTK